jgi:hypothetical protein
VPGGGAVYRSPPPGPWRPAARLAVAPGSVWVPLFLTFPLITGVLPV